MAIKSVMVEEYTLVDSFTNNILATLDKAAILPSVNEELAKATWHIDQKSIGCHSLYFLASMDLLKCMHELGHIFKCDTPESLTLFLFYIKIHYPEEYISYDTLDSLITKYHKMAEDEYTSSRPIIDISKRSFFCVADILGRSGFPKIRKQYIQQLHSITGRIAKADEIITGDEELWLDHIKTLISGVFDNNSEIEKPFNPLWHEKDYEKYYEEQSRKQDNESKVAESEVNIEIEDICSQIRNKSTDTVPSNVDSMLSFDPKASAVTAQEEPVEIKPVSIEPKEKIKKLSPEEQLDELVGLAQVKKSILEQLDFITYNQTKNLVDATPMIYLFVGEHGTGKQTVARIFASLCKERGLLSSSDLLCLDVDKIRKNDWATTSTYLMTSFGRWTGHAVYIKDADRLVQGKKDELGQKTLSFIFRMMNTGSFKKKVILILGGEYHPVYEMCSENSDSRCLITKVVDFGSFDAQSLYEIFAKTLSDNGMKMTTGAISVATHYIRSVAALHTRSFDNGRFVVDLADSVLVEQSNRISGKLSYTDDELFTIIAEDIQVAINLSTNDTYYQSLPVTDIPLEHQQQDPVEQKPAKEVPDNPATQKYEGKNVYLKKKNAKAMAVYNKKTGIIVLAGSILNDECTSSFNVERRNSQMEGNVEIVDGKITLINDLHFRTPSGASDFVLGASTNGWTEWKTRKGNSLDDLYRKK